MEDVVTRDSDRSRSRAAILSGMVACGMLSAIVLLMEHPAPLITMGIVLGYLACAAVLDHFNGEVPHLVSIPWIAAIAILGVVQHAPWVGGLVCGGVFWLAYVGTLPARNAPWICGLLAGALAVVFGLAAAYGIVPLVPIVGLAIVASLAGYLFLPGSIDGEGGAIGGADVCMAIAIGVGLGFQRGALAICVGGALGLVVMRFLGRDRIRLGLPLWLGTLAIVLLPTL